MYVTLQAMDKDPHIPCKQYCGEQKQHKVQQQSNDTEGIGAFNDTCGKGTATSTCHSHTTLAAQTVELMYLTMFAYTVA